MAFEATKLQVEHSQSNAGSMTVLKHSLVGMVSDNIGHISEAHPDPGTPACLALLACDSV